MSREQASRITVSVPGAVLQQMCNYVAIAETKYPDASLRALVLHALFTFEQDKATSIQEVASILKTVFGVDAPNHQVQESLDKLMSSGQVIQPTGMNYVLTPSARATVKERIDQSAGLQERVKMQWLMEMAGRYPSLRADLAWTALQSYLGKAFLRHGMQVAVLLDPSVELPAGYAASLSSLLSEAVQSKFEPILQETAKQAISNFLASVGTNMERAKYIAECADGAANYYSLAVSPNVAAQFRERLCPLTIFCDTNFLFGILDLHVHPLVEVSNHLLKAIDEHDLPLKMRYHPTTLQELQASISYYADILRGNKWSRVMSRAATTSPFMSGIEMKYHQINAESGIDVETFLRPYQHVDVLLEDRNIGIYRTTGDRLMQRATLESEYKDYLKRLGKDKPAVVSQR
jgi:predicted transcriptional regulator